MEVERMRLDLSAGVETLGFTQGFTQESKQIELK